MSAGERRPSMFDFIEKNASILVAVASTLISLCALGLSAYLGYATRRHNRLSLTPSLTTYLEREPISGADTAKFAWHLTNGGLGPAIISSYELLVDGKPVDTSSDSACLRAANALFGHTPTSFHFLNLKSGYLMRKDESRVVLSAVLSTKSMKPPDKLDDYNFLGEMLAKVKVSVKYKSLYGEDFALLE
jgi:hypothetical protein